MRTALVADHVRQEVLEEQALEEVLAASDADLLEDVGEVSLDGVLGDEEGTRDLVAGKAAHEEPYYLFFARAESVGGDVQPRYLFGFGGPDDDH
jgi:hypothetical protein